MTRRPGDDDLDPVVEHLERRTGLSFSGSQRPRLLAAVRAGMRAAGADGPAAYQRLLDESGEARAALESSVTVDESYFFRETRQLDLLRQVAVPEVQSRLGAGHEVAVWSAGCAAGQEAYTMAILLHEHPAVSRYRVVGTDLDGAAVAAAAEAEYSAWSLRALDDAARRRYFARRRGRYRLRDAYRRRVRFEQANLLDGAPAEAAFDVVLCRNVLIYLTADGVARSTAALGRALAPGGWLVTGPSDPSLTVEGLVRVRTDHGLAYRRAPEGAAAAPEMSAPAPAVAAAEQAAAGPGRRRGAPRRPSVATRSPGAVRSPVLEPDERLAGARRSLEAGRPGDAETAARDLLAGGVDEAAVHAVLVRALADRGRVYEAAAAADAGAARHPGDPVLRYLSAAVLLAAGRPAEAAGPAADAARLDPTSAAAHLLRAAIALRLDDAGAAERSLDRARALLRAMAPGETVALTGESAEDLLAAIGPARGSGKP